MRSPNAFRKNDRCEKSKKPIDYAAALGAQLSSTRTLPKHCDRLLPQQERSLGLIERCDRFPDWGGKAIALKKSLNKSQHSFIARLKPTHND
jgi:hypothetical protein